MSKLPAMQFYVGDWRKDPGVQALSYHDRGVWFELLCFMHESPNRGCLQSMTNALKDPEIAQLLGLPEAEWKQTRSRLEALGVASVDENGALVSRRMVNDEKLRRAKAEAGRKGGLISRPPKQDGSEIEANGGSSVSVSSSEKKEDVEKAVFDYWLERRRAVLKLDGRGVTPKLTKKRRSRISARLADGYDPETLCRAVEGCLASEYHTKNGYTDIELICRDGQHVEQFLAKAPRASDRTKLPMLLGWHPAA